MTAKDESEFGSLFDEMEVQVPSSVESKAELFDFDDGIPSDRDDSPAETVPADEATTPSSDRQDDPQGQKRRSSEDFSPDMDALLITAQSSMIIDGMRCLTRKDFSATSLGIFSEAVKGAELIIKILARNPGSYYRIAKLMDNDVECKEVEAIAFQLFRKKHREVPDDDEKKMRAFEELRTVLMNGYNKCLVLSSMYSIKKYYMLSGNLDQDKMTGLARAGNAVLRNEVSMLRQHVKIAIDLLKSGDYEIGTGLRGKDVSIFIIKASQLLSYYYLVTGNGEGEKYYRRMHETYKKYFIVR